MIGMSIRLGLFVYFSKCYISHYMYDYMINDFYIEARLNTLMGLEVEGPSK